MLALLIRICCKKVYLIHDDFLNCWQTGKKTTPFPGFSPTHPHGVRDRGVGERIRGQGWQKNPTCCIQILVNPASQVSAKSRFLSRYFGPVINLNGV